MSKNFIFSMHDLKKVVPPGKTIVEGVSLSFFHGAKIGVLGLNGAGKSTVLRIMAGVDTEFSGEARPAPGTRIGYLAQEPLVDEAKTVREIVEEGVSETRALLDRFEEISMKFGEVSDDDEMQKLLDEHAFKRHPNDEDLNEGKPISCDHELFKVFLEEYKNQRASANSQTYEHESEIHRLLALDDHELVTEMLNKQDVDKWRKWLDELW